MAEFDRHSDRYDELVRDSIRFSGQERAFFLEAKALRLLDVARRRLGDPGRVRALDVGCGDGVFDAYLTELGELEGVDASEAMVELARTTNPRARYQVADAAELPFPEGSFDLAFAVCVLHHVPPEERDGLAAELRRVTRVGGLVVVFEHNPWNPLTRLVVTRCAFDEHSMLLGHRKASRRLAAAGLRPVEHGYLLFFPWRGRITKRLEATLAPVPLGAQYYVAAHV